MQKFSEELKTVFSFGAIFTIMGMLMLLAQGYGPALFFVAIGSALMYLCYRHSKKPFKNKFLLT